MVTCLCFHAHLSRFPHFRWFCSLQGPSVLVCGDSGSWSSLPPECKTVSCGLPPVIKDAVVTGSNYTFGSTVTYTCKEGYVKELNQIGTLKRCRTAKQRWGTCGPPMMLDSSSQQPQPCPWPVVQDNGSYSPAASAKPQCVFKVW